MRLLRGWFLVLPLAFTLASCRSDSGSTVLTARSVEEALALASAEETYVVVKFWFPG